MNYKAHYDKLIARGQRTLIHGYREKHHIIPRCMGGDNNEDNLVYLTAEEHYVAHQLLVKMYPGNYKLLRAVIALCMGNNNMRRNNKLVGRHRKAYAESLIGKKRVFSDKGLENMRKNGRRPKSKETREKLKRINLTRKPITDETRKKLSQAGMGRTSANKGKPARNKGIPMSQEQKDSISATKKLNPPTRVSCMKCKKDTIIGAFNAFHKHLD